MINRLHLFAAELIQAGSLWQRQHQQDCKTANARRSDSKIATRQVQEALALGIERTAMVVGDPSLIESVFHSLISNSKEAFASREDLDVRSIEISLEKYKDGFVRITYCDNAGGIPVELS